LLNGSLLTRDFLIEGVRGTAAWNPSGTRLDDAVVATVRTRLIVLFANIRKLKNPTEAETEKELIWPLLEAIGWADISVQQNLSAKAREDVPDALLFADASAKAKAAPLHPWQRFQHGVCVVEAKRWNRVLDREEARRKGEDGVPSTQMLRYLRRVSYVVTNKWLKAGYAEALRDLFSSKGQVEFVADFGHAKHFFPDADVFPSVVVVRKPAQGETAPMDTQVCVIPRDAVPEKGLSAAVAAASPDKLPTRRSIP
jgi:hypothetical protein